MNKEVIYIDVEDDITTIVGKIKASDAKVVALVPPKRVGVLQSAVNMSLLRRTAEQNNKHVVLITADPALAGLAASAKIPVAKNLQSKPEIAPIAALKSDDEDDIIDGRELPVGEHAASSETDPSKTLPSAMPAVKEPVKQAPVSGKKLPDPKAKKGTKVPNFNRLRKRLFLIIGLAVLLIAFLIWAIFFAAHATIVIQAKTTAAPVRAQVTAETGAKTDAGSGVIAATSESDSINKSVDFEATGKKDAGKKATGTVTFTTGSISDLGRSIPAGTRLESSSGKSYTTDSSATISQDGGRGVASASITAAENGDDYNAASGSMSGAPGNISTRLDGPTSGGVSKTVKVVSASDVQRARQKLVDAANDEKERKQRDLSGKFDKEAVVIDDSMTIDYDDVSSDPAVGGEANSGTVRGTIKYTLYGVEKSDLKDYLKAQLEKDLKGNANQRVYADGADDAKMEDVSVKDGKVSFTLVATGKVGPRIDESRIKQEARGKNYGDIQSSIEGTEGVESVDTKFSPFWVRTVPNDTKKIKVEFKLDQKQNAES